MTMALLVALNGVRHGYFQQEVERKITSSKMKFFRGVKGRQTNANIRRELKIVSLKTEIVECKSNWSNHFERTHQNRLP